MEETTTRCSICGQDKDPDAFDKRRKFATCKACIRDAKATGKSIHILPDKPSEVVTVKDLIDYTVWRCGCYLESGRWKSNVIIFKESGYSVKELAEVANWCAENSKHPEEPWKIMFWVEQYRSDRYRSQTTDFVDPIQKKLDDLYVTASAANRKKILEVSGKADKRDAMALIKELTK